MKYMLLVYLDENALTESERAQCYQDSAKLTRDLDASGNYLDASPLHPVATATSVRIRENKTQVTDGPFAETREQLGGFYLVDAADLDRAIEIATKIPVVTAGTIEIRPVMEIPGLPEKTDLTGGRIQGDKGVARLLGIKPNTLRHRMKKLGIPDGHRATIPDN